MTLFRFCSQLKCLFSGIFYIFKFVLMVIDFGVVLGWLPVRFGSAGIRFGWFYGWLELNELPRSKVLCLGWLSSPRRFIQCPLLIIIETWL